MKFRFGDIFDTRFSENRFRPSAEKAVNDAEPPPTHQTRKIGKKRHKQSTIDLLLSEAADIIRTGVVESILRVTAWFQTLPQYVYSSTGSFPAETEGGELRISALRKGDLKKKEKQFSMGFKNEQEASSIPSRSHGGRVGFQNRYLFSLTRRVWAGALPIEGVLTRVRVCSRVLRSEPLHLVCRSCFLSIR